MMSTEEREALQKLTTTAAPYPSAEWENARGALANAVPDLLSDIEQLRRTAQAAIKAVAARDSQTAAEHLAELARITQ